MRTLLVAVGAVLFTTHAGAAPPGRVTPKEAADGWVDLFDGETTFGWETAAAGSILAVKDGVLTLTAGKEAATATFALPLPAFEFKAEMAGRAIAFQPDITFLTLSAGSPQFHAPLRHGAGQAVEVSGTTRVLEGVLTTAIRTGVFLDESKMVVGSPGAGPITIGLRAWPTRSVSIKGLKVRPLDTKPIFDGKTLAGWTKYSGEPKREKSQFSVTPAGELQVKDGPGDLRTDASYDDFLLQFRCKTNGPALNSGVFFRCIPAEYQNGYEAQIQNAFKDSDRTKPADFGTGAIYRRVPARKVVSNDKEYFTFTLLAAGPRIATWVDGYPAVNWLDDRKPDDNPRKGLRTKAGHLSIQGHDPTTDIVFRDIRVTPVK